jgi:hypothetical protein
MYDYDLMLDLDELTLAFEHCGIIEIPLNNARLRRAAIELEDNGVIEVIGKNENLIAYSKVS